MATAAAALRRAFDAVRREPGSSATCGRTARPYPASRRRSAARGLSRDEAARQARVEFGAIESYKEACRDARGLPLIRPFLGLFGDISLAFVGCWPLPCF